MHRTDTIVAPNLVQVVERSPRPIRGVDDWPLDLLITLDGASPGFLARVMSSGDLRRQAIFAALSQGIVDAPQGFLNGVADQNIRVASAGTDPLTQVAAVLAHARARIIVAATFGSCPPRLLGFLRRLGPQPFIFAAYRRLHNLAADPDAQSAVRYLLSRDRLTILDIEKAERLHSEVLSSKLARSIHASSEIERVNTVIEIGLKACSSVTPEWLAQSLGDVSVKTTLGDWLHGLVERFDNFLVPPPFQGDDEAVLLSTGAAIMEAGHRYKNCMKTMVTDSLAGHSFFYEFVNEKVVAHVRMLTDGTGFVEGVYARRNKTVEEPVARRVRDKLAHVGLPSVFRGDGRRDLKAVSSLHAPWTFRDLDDEDGE